MRRDKISPELRRGGIATSSDGAKPAITFQNPKRRRMAPPNPVQIGRVEIGRGRPLALIAGPCVMEPGDMTMRIANRLVEICEDLSVPLVFKASFDKANRTSGSSFRGPGLV